MSAVDPYAFMSPATAGTGVALRTPMERRHIAAGAAIEKHGGWRIGVYPDDGDGDPWIVDVSHFGKLDLRATASGLDQLTGGLAPGEMRHGASRHRTTAVGCGSARRGRTARSGRCD